MVEERRVRERGRPAGRAGAGLVGALGLGLALALVGTTAHALDTVFLVDGGRVRGTVMVEDASGVSIRLPDGTVRTYKKSEVREVRYDEPGVTTKTPPPTPAPAPSPAPSTAPPAPPSAPPPALAPLAPRASCARDADCAAGLGCDARGLCVAPMALGPRCERDDDCGAGQGCNAQNVCVSFGPSLGQAPWASSPDGAPPGYRYERRPIKGLAMAGFLLFGATYVTTVAVAAPVALALDSRKVGDSVAVAAIPLLGGILSDVDFIEPGYGTSAPLGTIVSVLQISGLVLGVVGLAAKRKTLVPLAAHVTPWAGAGMGGVTFSHAW
jgi:hypothetical protein